MHVEDGAWGLYGLTGLVIHGPSIRRFTLSDVAGIDVFGIHEGLCPASVRDARFQEGGSVCFEKMEVRSDDKGEAGCSGAGSEGEKDGREVRCLDSGWEGEGKYFFGSLTVSRFFQMSLVNGPGFFLALPLSLVASALICPNRGTENRPSRGGACMLEVVRGGCSARLSW
jgi:hypothetical protein